MAITAAGIFSQDVFIIITGLSYLKIVPFPAILIPYLPSPLVI
jgi:hypothetical protein